MKARKRPGPSREPQMFSKDVWYYEDKASLEFIVWSSGNGQNPKSVTRFRVPVGMLRESLARIGPAKKRKTAPAKE